MIERLLAAERALAGADLDAAGRLFQQVADADPRNAIAVVGLARVAEARGEREAARALVERALEIDPDEALAGRLHASLQAADAAAPTEAASGDRPDAAPVPATQTRGEPVPDERVRAAGPAGEPANPRRRGGLIGWLRRLLRL